MVKLDLRYVLFGMLVLIFVFSFYYLMDGIQTEKFNEKFIDKKFDLDLIADNTEWWINRDDDWEAERQFYEDNLIINAHMLDNVKFVFSAIYNNDLENISIPVPTYSISYDPFNDAKFVELIKNNDKGELSSWFENKEAGVKGREMKVYFRWTPLIESIHDRYLLVVAISKLSVASDSSSQIIIGSFGMIAGIVLTTAFVFVFGYRRRRNT